MKNTLYHGRPEDVSDRLEKEIACYALLDSLGVAYDRVDHDFADLLMMPGEKVFKTKDLSKQLGVARLSFASPEDMLRLLNITPGSVSVLGLMNDRENEVQLVIDKPVLEDARFGCHPCINSSTLAIATQDLMQKILPAVHHEVILVDLPEEAAEG